MAADRNMKSDFSMSDGSTFGARYALGRKLGDGGFGVVYAGTRVQDSLAVAIKVIPDFLFKGRMDPYDEQLPLEVSILHRVSDIDGVVQLIDACFEDTNLMIVMEYVEGGMDLGQLMDTTELSHQQIRKLFRRLVETVVQVQAKGIVHRDIKPENILMDPRTHSIKLIDFGCSSYAKKSYKSFRGSYDFHPPEYFQKGRIKSQAATVWSLGVTLYVLQTGRYPYYNLDRLTRQECADIYFPEDVPWMCQHLIRSLLAHDDSHRPTLKEMLLHPYMGDGPMFRFDVPSLPWQHLPRSNPSFLLAPTVAV